MVEKRTRSAALIAAQKRYAEKNRAAKNHIAAKSTTKRFILEKATLDDLAQVKEWLRQREKGGESEDEA